MSIYSRYWSIALARGVLAIAAGLFAFAIPSLTFPFLFQAITIVFCVIVLASYGICDSVLTFISSRAIPSGLPGRPALAVQGLLGSVSGVLLLAVGIDWIRLDWFLYIAAAQALVIAATEFITARSLHRHSGKLSCYATSVVAFGMAGILLMSRNLSDSRLISVLFSYLEGLGITLFVLGARMLLAERHPVPTQA
jgi:uncharacterized membrane protein HdeD (DUF308 family)